MANGYAKEIQNRIGAAPDGTIFIVSDFADVADSETIRRNLNRLVQAGTLRRILKGVFEKPKYSKLLGEYVAADPDAVAKALARCYHWTIAPCGDTALNMLGLSMQFAPSSGHWCVCQRPLGGAQRPPLLRFFDRLNDNNVVLRCPLHYSVG